MMRVSSLSYAEQDRRMKAVQQAAKRLLKQDGACSRRSLFDADKTSDLQWITRVLNRFGTLGATTSVGAGPNRAHKAKDVDMLTRIATDDRAAAGVLWGSMPEPQVQEQAPEAPPEPQHQEVRWPKNAEPFEEPPTASADDDVKQLLVAYATAVVALGERVGRVETKLDRILQELGVRDV
jgi:hypothetical protein